MAGHILVRSATADDADAIGRIHVETWQVCYRGQIPDDYLDGLSVERRREAWRRTLAGGDPDWPEMSVWVAAVADEAVGFCGAGPSRDDDADESIGEVYAIYVDPPRWDTGAGAALMQQAVNWLRGPHQHATLWVLDSNDRARRFYEKGGWKPDGATKVDDRGSFVLREVRYRIDL